MQITPKLARVNAGISAKEMAETLGMSRWTYAAREKCPETFTIEEAKALAKKLDMPVESIFFDTNSN